MKKIKVCIVGCGRIASLNCLGYKGNPDACVFAVCDVDRSRAEAFAADLGAEKVYTSFDDVCADPEIDAVDILLPHHLHCEYVIRACKAGKHVSVQKPMAMTLEECDKMIAAARMAGVKLKVFENFIFYPPYVKAKEIIDSDELGKPLSLRIKMISGYSDRAWNIPVATWAWRMKKETGGGGPMVFDDGYHKFSLARYFMGEPEKVFAYIENTPGDLVEMKDGTKVRFYCDAPALISWKYKDSATYGSFEIINAPEMEINSKYYPGDERVEITCERGVIQVTRCTAMMEQIPTLTVYKDGITTAYHVMDDDWADSFIASTHDFIDAIKNDRDPVLTGEEGKEVMKFTLAAIRAGELGQQVLVDDMELF